MCDLAVPQPVEPSKGAHSAMFNAVKVLLRNHYIHEPPLKQINVEMPRYDVITYMTRGQNYHGGPTTAPSELGQENNGLTTIPREFLEAVNASLAKGATLVGGVSTSAGGKSPHSCYFSFSQAVLYP